MGRHVVTGTDARPLRIWAKRDAPPYVWKGPEEVVLEVIHMQKTGGKYFEKVLMRHIERPARPDVPEKKQYIHVESRITSSWRYGVHASLARVASILDKKRSVHNFLTAPRPGSGFRYYTITMLREPLARFMSEFLHNSSVSLDAWDWNDGRARKYPSKVRRIVRNIASDKFCGSGRVIPIPSKRCMKRLCPKYRPPPGGYGTCLPKSPAGLRRYIGCPVNQGLNRMTRMLGDPLCHPDPGHPKHAGDVALQRAKDDRMACMLETAKRNLLDMCVARAGVA